ncbi:hypothetical protein [Paraburkholderia megapolitana]|uniref:hypothetical protein n=1 Tax=Paraburkholderia megapolitana TaxID=420953 RepID=UPI0038BA3238
MPRPLSFHSGNIALRNAQRSDEDLTTVVNNARKPAGIQRLAAAGYHRAAPENSADYSKEDVRNYFNFDFDAAPERPATPSTPRPRAALPSSQQLTPDRAAGNAIGIDEVMQRQRVGLSDTRRDTFAGKLNGFSRWLGENHGMTFEQFSGSSADKRLALVDSFGMAYTAASLRTALRSAGLL